MKVEMIYARGMLGVRRAGQSMQWVECPLAEVAETVRLFCATYPELDVEADGLVIQPVASKPLRACPDCGCERRYYKRLSGGAIDSVCPSCGRRGANDNLSLAEIVGVG